MEFIWEGMSAGCWGRCMAFGAFAGEDEQISKWWPSLPPRPVRRERASEARVRVCANVHSSTPDFCWANPHPWSSPGVPGEGTIEEKGHIEICTTSSSDPVLSRNPLVGGSL